MYSTVEKRLAVGSGIKAFIGRMVTKGEVCAIGSYVRNDTFSGRTGKRAQAAVCTMSLCFSSEFPS